MKKTLLLLSSVIIFFLISCSNPQGVVLTPAEDTLRNELEEKAKSLSWANEIEAERLSSPLNKNIITSSNEYISPQMLSSINELQAPLYPEIKSFASTDCSAMNNILLSTLNNFCQELCKGTDNLQTYFYSNYFFNYIFFKSDLEEFIKELKTDENLFDRYIICKAFESQDLVQVPVRFYKNKEYIDLSVYLAYHNGYKITQIEVIRWGKLYGEREED